MLSRLNRLISRKSTRPNQTPRRTRRRNLATAIQGLESRQLLAAGGLDPTFGDAGIVTTNMGPSVRTDDYADNVSVQQPDGKILVAGRLQDPLQGFGLVVTRYLPDGSPDTTFDGDGKFTDFQTGISSVHGMDLQSNGQIVVSGNNRITRINTNGTLDNTFGNGGFLQNSHTIQDLIIAANDDILVGGWQYIDSTFRSDLVVTRIDADGTGLVADFGQGGAVIQGFGVGHDERGRELAIGDDGSIFLVGETFDRLGNSSSSDYRDYVAMKLTDSGDVIWAREIDGGSSAEATLAASVDHQNRVVIAGAGSDFTVLRLTEAGDLDNSFGGGVVTTEFGIYQSKPSDLLVEPDGKVVVTGWSFNPTNQFEFAIAKYDTDGLLDSSFGNGGSLEIDFDGRRDFPTGIASQTDGKIVVAGYSQDLSLPDFQHDFAVTRVTTTGQLDSSFGDGGILLTDVSSEVESYDVAEAVSVQQPDGKILVAGIVNGDTEFGFGITRYLSDGSLDPTFGDGGKATIFDTGIRNVEGIGIQSDGRIIVAGFERIVRLSEDGQRDIGFASSPYFPTNGILETTMTVRDLEIDDNDRIVVAGDRYLNSTNGRELAVARFESNGSGYDTSFGQSGQRLVDIGGNNDLGRNLSIGTDGSIYVGGQTQDRSVPTTSSSYLDYAAIKLTASGDVLWSRRIDSGDRFEVVTSVGVDSQNRLVMSGTGDDFQVVRLLPNGDLDTDFGGGMVSVDFGVFASPLDLIVDSNDDVFVAGYAVNPGTGHDFAVANLESDGSLNEAFGDSGTVTHDIMGGFDFGRGIELQSDGKILVAGSAQDLEANSTATDRDFALVRMTVNAAPQVFDLDATVSENGPATSISAVFNDDLGDTHTYSIDTPGTRGSVTNVGDGTFVYDPAGSFESLSEGLVDFDSFTYTVTDNQGATGTGTVTVTINGENDAPVATNHTTTATEDGLAVEIPALADDVDGNNSQLTYAIIAQPSVGAATSNPDGTFHFDPGSDFQDLAAGEVRQVSFTFTATDRIGSVSNTGTVTVDVTGVNDAPVATSQSINAAEDGAVVTTGPLVSDIDSDDGATTLAVTIDSQPSAGTASVNADGTLSFDPGSDFQQLAAGETKQVSFEFSATDSQDAVSNTGTVTVTVTGVNDAPQVFNLDPTVNEDGPTASISAVFNDENGDTHTFSLDTSSTLGNVTNIGDGTFSYDPTGVFDSLSDGETANDSFTYTVTDNHGAAATGTVFLTITGENDAPVASNASINATEDGAVVTTSQIVSDIDSDDDATTLAVTINTQPISGTASVNADGTLSFDPGSDFQHLAAGETKQVSFEFSATDSHGAVSNTGSVTVTVTGVNDAPYVFNLDPTVSEDGPSASISAVFNDENGDTQTFSVDTTNTVGNVTNNGDGTFSYDPTGVFDSLSVGATANDSFTYTVTDNYGAAATGTVFLTVTGKNDTPVASNASINATEDGAVVTTSQIVSDIDSDDDATTLAVTINTQPISGTASVNADGTLSFDPGSDFQQLAEGETKQVSFEFSATDSHGAVSNTGTVNVTVTGVNDVPLPSNDSYQTDEDALLVVNAGNGLLANDSDVDATDTLSVAAINGVPASVGVPVELEHGVMIVSADGSLTYEAGVAQDVAGESETFSYTVSDGNGAWESAVVTIDIVPAVASDSLNFQDGILRINGTDNDDIIELRDINGALQLNGADTGISVADIDEIRIWSRGGNDRIDLNGLNIASFIHAGDGDDDVTGGSATDMVFGGLGNDKLTGASGNDFLIGGLGADRIVGSSGHDILVADAISPTASKDVLNDILDSWVAQAVELEEAELTDEVFADGETDKLTGGSGSDWFVVGDDDRITDLKKKNKDGDFVSRLL